EDLDLGAPHRARGAHTVNQQDRSRTAHAPEATPSPSRRAEHRCSPPRRRERPLAATTGKVCPQTRPIGRTCEQNRPEDRDHPPRAPCADGSACTTVRTGALARGII